MNTFETVTQITIDDDAKVIQFKKQFQKAECNHRRVTIHEAEDTITCNECDAKLNPIKWITLHLTSINNALNSARERLAIVEVIKENCRRKTASCARNAMR